MGPKSDRLPETRAERYRHRAEDALRKAAETTNPDHRKAYFSMAAGWHEIANEAEETAVALKITAARRAHASKASH